MTDPIVQPGRGVLDTNTVIVLSRITDATTLPEEPLITAVTLAELSVGPHRTTNWQPVRGSRPIELSSQLLYGRVPFSPLSAIRYPPSAIRRPPSAIRRALDSGRYFNYSSDLMRRRLGEFEQTLLLALAGAGADVSGVDVREYIEARTGRTVSPGAIYTAFQRLERRGLVASRLGEPSQRRGGKRPKLYRLQPDGARTLRDMESVLVRLGYRLTPKRGSR